MGVTKQSNVPKVKCDQFVCMYSCYVGVHQRSGTKTTQKDWGRIIV